MPGTANSGGRNRKSNQLHLVTGTYRRDRHGDRRSPEPPKGVPVPPKALNQEERGEWDRMVHRLTQNGTLSVVEDAALFEYVQLFGETQRIKSDLEENRKLASALKKQASRLDGSDLLECIKEIVSLRYLINKGTRDLRQGHMGLRQWLVEFGLTPAARSRVKLPGDGEEKKNPFEAFMAGRK